ncbi:MAG: DUF1972 domain-containing protein [Bacteroidales bacterium]|nr:DUF1972 domain-containing protein [Bacteroidales bacterium]
MKKKIAVIGTRGVPAHYGGFESLVENLLDYASEGVEYTVFCSSKDLKSGRSPKGIAASGKPERPASYKGATLKYVGLHANGAQSMFYDLISMLRCLSGYDTLLVLGVSGCLFLPLVRLLLSRKTKLVVNIDGLEHKRDKWNKLARWILLTSEKMAVRYADTVISDNQAITDYVVSTYGLRSENALVTVAYGGDHVFREVSGERQREILAAYGLQAGGYAFSVCRIEPENNCHITLEAFAGAAADGYAVSASQDAVAQAALPLLLIGNWEHSEWARQLRSRFQGKNGVILADAVYDLDVLYTLRSNAALYVHGHSAGGTNPSLVEAMFFGRPIFAFDVPYNRETTFGKAVYFRDADSLMAGIAQFSATGCERSEAGAELQRLAMEHYRWADIAARYEKIY